MRLTDLEPRWVGHPGMHTGFTFRCPHCPDSGQRIAVMMWPWIMTGGVPLDSVTQPTRDQKALMWQRTNGESFKDITVSPSVNAEGAGHWHGCIVGGEVA